MRDEPYKKLASNTIVFSIASFGSRIISFVMVPLYSYLLTKEEYGTIDLVLTISSFLVPILFLSINDAVLRYVMDKSYDNKSVVSNSMIVLFCGAVVFLFGLPIITRIYPQLSRYLFFLTLVLFSSELNTVFNALLRALGKVKMFAINGILHTLVFVGCNVLFLVGFHMKVEGYLLSQIISSGISFCFAFISCKSWNYIGFCYDKAVLRKILIYSVPLIPNAIMWWIMDVSDKFVVTFYLGVAANGLYAMAKKIPSIIDMFNGFFNQAWRLSAIEENDADYVKGFTSRVYEMYYLLHTLVIGLLLIVSKPFVMILSESYRATWEYIPLLLISVSVSSLSAFLGSKFVANEKTMIIFRTTIIGAIVNTILNFALIPHFGLNGAGAATFVGFAVVLLVREKKLLVDNELDIAFRRWPLLTIIVVEIFFYYILPIWWTVIVNACVLCLFIGFKREIILKILSRLFGLIKSRKKRLE